MAAGFTVGRYGAATDGTWDGEQCASPDDLSREPFVHNWRRKIVTGVKSPWRKPNQSQVERRRSARAALHLGATMRDGAARRRPGSSTCRPAGAGSNVQPSSSDESWVWLGIEGLQNQRCRVAWHCEEFIGLEFETPLSEAVFERLCKASSNCRKPQFASFAELPAEHTGWLARQAIRTSPFSRIFRANAPRMR